MTILEYIIAGGVFIIIALLCIAICIVSGEISREEEYSEWKRKDKHD